ncbi:MAG: cytidylate kinase-like family protein [Muribaculaceae bacterium]|nr:cytidylate kinase-like family protein [Muribaculaceae bacterium]
MKDNCIIVIGRQFGSGGRRIGRLVAASLGFDYYDSELLSQAAESLGFDKDIFLKHDERKPSTLRTVMQGLYGIADNFHPVSLGGERIYAEQRRIIQEICKDRSCVIVGRTADYILRKHPALFSVFLHSPLEKRAQVVLKRGEAATLKEAMELARTRDKERESYYNYFTGEGKWGKAANYHLSIETSALDDDTIAELILTAVKSRYPHLNNRITI